MTDWDEVAGSAKILVDRRLDVDDCLLLFMNVNALAVGHRLGLVDSTFALAAAERRRSHGLTFTQAEEAFFGKLSDRRSELSELFGAWPRTDGVESERIWKLVVAEHAMRRNPGIERGPVVWQFFARWSSLGVWDGVVKSQSYGWSFWRELRRAIAQERLHFHCDGV